MDDGLDKTKIFSSQSDMDGGLDKTKIFSSQSDMVSWTKQRFSCPAHHPCHFVMRKSLFCLAHHVTL
jgi:hypothetical protein